MTTHKFNDASQPSTAQKSKGIMFPQVGHSTTPPQLPHSNFLKYNSSNSLKVPHKHPQNKKKSPQDQRPRTEASVSRFPPKTPTRGSHPLWFRHAHSPSILPSPRSHETPFPWCSRTSESTTGAPTLFFFLIS